MRRAIRRPLLVAILASPLAACFFWDSGDAPPPILGPHGSLEVNPWRMEFALSPPLDDAGAPNDDMRVHIRARTANGAGAESVRVTVSIGACGGRLGGPPQDSGGVADPALVPDENAPGIADDSVSLAQQVSVVALSDGGCGEESARQLGCILSADGVADFVVRLRTERQATGPTPVPICVRAAGADEQEEPLEVHVRPVTPQAADAGLTLSTAAVIAPRRSNLTQPDCLTPWLETCADGPRSSILSAQLQIDGSPAAAMSSALVRFSASDGLTLSASADCRESAPTRVAPLRGGNETTDALFLCASARGGTIAVRAEVVGQQDVRGSTTVDVRAQPARLERQGSDLVLLDCRGEPVVGEVVNLTTEGSVAIDAGGGKTDDRGRAATITVGPDAGDAFVSVTLPASGQTCRLKVSP